MSTPCDSGQGLLLEASCLTRLPWEGVGVVVPSFQTEVQGEGCLGNFQGVAESTSFDLLTGISQQAQDGALASLGPSLPTAPQGTSPGSLLSHWVCACAGRNNLRFEVPQDPLGDGEEHR